MKYSSSLVQDLPPARNSKIIPRCVVLVFVAGIVFYCLYSVVRIPANEVTSGHFVSGNAHCNCTEQKDIIKTEESIDWKRLFYNRVPKCGSTTIVTLLRKLYSKHRHRHFHSTVYSERNISDEEQRKIVSWVKGKGAPCSFDRHVFFIDFTRFGERTPVYMNIVREPVERIISSYFYRRSAARMSKVKVKPSEYWLNKKFEQCVLTSDPECTFLEGQNLNFLQLQVPYFCGQEPRCQILNDPWAINKAKQNIEKYYAVIGTLEHMNMTLQVLEKVLPEFFKGAYKMYQNSGLHANRNTHEEVPEELKSILRTNLTTEYELFYFVQQRLFKQYQSLVLENDEKEEEEEEEEAFDVYSK